MSSQIRENYSTEVEAAVSRLASLHLGPPAPTSLWASISTRGCGSRGRHHFFRLGGGEEAWCEGAERLLKMQNQPVGRIFFQDALKPPQDEWAKLRTMEASLALERNLTQALLELQALGSAPADPQLCDFLQNHFRGEEVKLIKKTGDT